MAEERDQPAPGPSPEVTLRCPRIGLPTCFNLYHSHPLAVLTLVLMTQTAPQEMR
jgi:hypothetical protein